jgi:hypothetical protein
MPNEWLGYLRQQDETGMDYQVFALSCTAVVSSNVQVRGYEDAPFSSADTKEMTINQFSGGESAAKPDEVGRQRL